MIGEVLIDNIDIATLGAFIEGEQPDIVEFPPTKEIESVSWAEIDGEEADLSNVFLSSKKLKIKFGIVGDLSPFLELLNLEVHHTINFANWSRSINIRANIESVDELSNLHSVIVDFSQDEPLKDYTYVAPQNDIVPAQGVYLDGIDLSEYGCYVLKGTKQGLTGEIKLKENVVISSTWMSGSESTDDVAKMDSNTVKMYLLMRANNNDAFWKNRDALLYNISQPGVHTIYSDELNDEFPGWYKQCSTQELNLFDTKKWWKFELVFQCIAPGAQPSTVLESENNYVLTHGYLDYAVLLN